MSNKFGTVTLNFWVPEGRDDDASIFADSDTLQDISDKIEDLAKSFLPPGWRVEANND